MRHKKARTLKKNQRYLYRHTNLKIWIGHVPPKRSTIKHVERSEGRLQPVDSPLISNHICKILALQMKSIWNSKLKLNFIKNQRTLIRDSVIFAFSWLIIIQYSKIIILGLNNELIIELTKSKLYCDYHFQNLKFS